MKKNFVLYIVTTLILLALYSIVIVGGGILSGITFSENKILIYNIILIIFTLMINFLFVITEKTSVIKKITLIIFLIASLFIPVKQQSIYEKISPSVFHLSGTKEYSIIDMIAGKDKIKSKKDDTDPSLETLRKYANNNEQLNISDIISKDGYINGDNALRIAATASISKGSSETPIKTYLNNVNTIEIKFIEKNEKNPTTYWDIQLGNTGDSVTEWASIKINYYTGEIIESKVTSTLYID